MNGVAHETEIGHGRDMIRIATDQGPRDVNGEAVSPVWAVTAILDSEDFTITHVPTGKGCASRVRGPRAVVLSIARIVADRFPRFDPQTDLAALDALLRRGL